MKKTIIAIALSMSAFTAFSQDSGSAFDTSYSSGSGSSSSELSFTSKNGHEVLPKAGDWALGIGASSVLGYMGDLFNGTSNNGSPSFNQALRSIPVPTVSVFGKKMVRDDFAYRASVSLYAISTNSKFKVDDDNSSNPDDYLFDRMKESNYGIMVNGGFENRRGRGRVQGIYGAEAYVYYSSGATRKFDYANAINVSNQIPSVAPGLPNGNPISGDVQTPALASRITKINRQDAFEVGLRAFVGVEYFFAPQMSIGGEFYLGAGYGITGGQSISAEGFDGNTNEVREYVNASESSSSLRVGTDNAGGSINLLFYF